MQTILQGLNELNGVSATMVFDGGGQLVACRGSARIDRAGCEAICPTLMKAIASIQLRMPAWQSLTTHFANGSVRLRQLGSPGGNPYYLAVVADRTLNAAFAGVLLRTVVGKLQGELARTRPSPIQEAAIPRSARAAMWSVPPVPSGRAPTPVGRATAPILMTPAQAGPPSGTRPASQQLAGAPRTAASPRTEQPGSSERWPTLVPGVALITGGPEGPLGVVQVAHLQWSSDLDTGIAPIDQQHRRLIEYVNELIDAKGLPDNRRAVRGVLDSMVDYALTHFAFEEELQVESGYAYARAHKRVHETFVAKVSESMQRFRAGEDVADELLSLLERWLIHHIKNDDADFAPVVKKKLALKESETRPGWLGRFFGGRGS
jgi:hemerythrin